MLKNLKIGKKLIISFILVALLSSVAGIASIFALGKFKSESTDTLERFGFGQADSARVLLYFNECQAQVVDIVGFTDQAAIDKAKARYDEFAAKYYESLKLVEERSPSSSGKQMIAEIKDLAMKWKSVSTEILDLGDTTDPEKSAMAQKRIVAELYPIYYELSDKMEDFMQRKIDKGVQNDKQLDVEFKVMVTVIIVLVVVSLGISVLLSIIISRGISVPISKCVERIKLLAKGDFTSPVPEIKTKDEMGVLADSTSDIVKTTSWIVEDLAYGLSEMGEGDFTVRSKNPSMYVQGWRPLYEAIHKIISGVTNLVIDIKRSSMQVSSGADQVSSGAQILSQGATEQAASIEELSATISEISKKITENAANADKAKRESDNAAAGLNKSDQSMQEMIVAMNDISEKSNEISKIIKTIDDIAFQTNILALNAAVEAARAGEAGKGFAVVADEVRNLAGKSAEAAKDTASLIAETVTAVERGSALAGNTAIAMNEARSSSAVVEEVIEEVHIASDDQAAAIQQITVAVDQISSVIQSNSATSEESAASAEELSAQAGLLIDMVGKFSVVED